MKLKKTDINLLIMLAGILIAVAAYFFVYTSYTEKTAALESENTVLAAEVDELQKLADNKKMYIDETAKMNQEITDTIARFPAGVMTEDVLMYAYTLENTEPVYFTSIGINGTQMVPVAVETAAPAQDAVVEEGAEAPADDAVVATGGMQDTVFLYNTPVTYGFKSTYKSIKDIMSGMVQGQDRMNLTSVSLSYDGETGCINGTLASNIYTMEGTGKYYELLDIPGVQLGVDDLFKSNPVLNINTNNSDYAGEEVGIADGTTEEPEGEESEDEEDKPVSEEN